jgi:uncharacterized FlaG/YvyC family protein
MNLAITPENAELNKRLEELHVAFLTSFTRHKYMVEDESPILTALYLEQLGRLQLELLEKQTEVSRLKMKIAMIHAALNRNEKPDLQHIDWEIHQKLDGYYREIAERSSQLDMASKMLGSLLSEEEAKKLKEVFYVLCRKLHPDLNPQQTTQEADLFIKVKAAYDLQQLDELQRILLYLDTHDSSDFTSHVADEKKQRIEQLEKSISGLKEKMAQLEGAFPFTMRELLGNESALAEKKAEIQSFIKSQEEEIIKQQTVLDIIVHE